MSTYGGGGDDGAANVGPSLVCGAAACGAPSAAGGATETTGGACGDSRRRFGGGDRPGHDGAGEIVEELIGGLFGDQIDQPRAHLRQLAADIGLDVIFELTALARLGQTRALPLAKPAMPPSPPPEIL